METVQGASRRLIVTAGDSTAHIRMDAMNRETIDHYFMLLHETLTTHGLMDKPSQIYNVDESGVPLNPRPPKIVTTKGRVTKKVRYRTSGRKGQVAVVGCANASGQAIPPMIIYGTKYGLSSNGRINTDLFEAWFLEHFLEKAVSARPLFLLLDGHSTHYQPQVIRLAVEHNCIILCLPPHTTHEAQPLDVGVFAPLKVQWTRVCHEFYQKNPGSVVTKCNFSRLFSQTWCLAVTPVNITSGFRRAGVYLLDQNVLTLTEVCNPPTALESEASSSSNTTTAASVSNVEATPVSTMPSAAHTDIDESADVPAGTSATNTQLDSAAVSVENLSAKEVERFERRYNEGFDLPDPVYQVWVEVHHPNTSTSPLTSKGLEPSLAELFSAVPPQSPVTLDVRLTPVSSSASTSSGVPSSGSSSSGVPSSASTSKHLSANSPSLATSSSKEDSALSKFLVAPSVSMPCGPKKAPPRACLLTSTAALEMSQEKEKKKKQEAVLKERKRQEREESKQKREEERKRKLDERARRAEERAKDKSKKTAEKACKLKEKVQQPPNTSSKGNHDTSTSSTRSSSKPPPPKKARVAHEAIDDSRCCVCFTTYEDDVLNKTGKDWVGCACGRWLHEECMEDCVLDSLGKERLCPLCVDIFAV